MKKEKLIESSILRSFQGTLQATARFPTGVENMGGVSSKFDWRGGLSQCMGRAWEA